MQPLKLEEITPEKLIEIDQHAENVRLTDLTLSELGDLSQKRQSAMSALEDIELACKVRVLKAYGLGFSIKELAKIFNVTPNTIKKWIGQ